MFICLTLVAKKDFCEISCDEYNLTQFPALINHIVFHCHCRNVVKNNLFPLNKASSNRANASKLKKVEKINTRVSTSTYISHLRAIWF